MPLDTSSHHDLDTLVEMLREASQSRDPKEVLTSFGKRLWHLNAIEAMISLSVRNLPDGQFKITRNFRRAELPEVFQGQAPDPWKNWHSMPTHTEGFLADVIAAGRPQMFHHLSLGGDPVLGDRLADIGSAVATPIFDDGRALNWNIQFRSEPEGFTRTDLAEHVLNANLIGSITRTLVAVQEEKRLKHRLQQQLDELASVQQALLPTSLPNIPGLRLAASYLTSDEAGGDYYDFVPLPEGKWGVLIADVAGHGAAAAAVMAMLHAIVHGYEGEISPESVLRYANRRLCQSSIQGRFVTAFLGLYDPKTSTLSYVRAGHNPPKLKRTAGELIDLDGASTLPMGVIEDIEIHQEELRLEPGETLVLYTDGITEAFAPDRELFGIERLDKALTGAPCDPDGIIDAVHAALFNHTGRLDRDDDQTLVVLQRHDQP